MHVQVPAAAPVTVLRGSTCARNASDDARRLAGSMDSITRPRSTAATAAAHKMNGRAMQETIIQERELMLHDGMLFCEAAVFVSTY